MFSVIYFFMGCIIGYLVFRFSLRSHKQALDDLGADIIKQAELQAKEITIKAKQQAEAYRFELEQEAHSKFFQEENRLSVIKEELQLKITLCDKERKTLEQKIISQNKEEKKFLEKKKKNEELLTTIAQMTRKEAETYLYQQVEANVQTACETLIQRSVSQAEQLAEQHSVRIVQTALGRITGMITANSAIDLVELPNDTCKGKIIGREGRNKKAFEDATGVALIIDTTSNTIALSSFDPERRYIAKKVLQELLITTKIHTEVIQNCVRDKQVTFENECVLIGKEAAFKAHVTGLQPEVLKVLGKLQFRLSNGQNILLHSIEVASIAEAIAAELKLDHVQARRMGLLHDIGKALPLKYGATHALAGAAFLQQHGENEYICNGVASHHDEVGAISIEACLLKSADAISAGKPGARDDTKEAFFSRLHYIETMAREENGVLNAYAIDSGREVQVFVTPELFDDRKAHHLAEKLSYRINKDVKLPYPIKISVIRELKASNRDAKHS